MNSLNALLFTAPRWEHIAGGSGLLISLNIAVIVAVPRCINSEPEARDYILNGPQ